LPSGDLHVAFHTAEPRTAHALLNAWHPALEKISTGRTVIDRIRRIAGDAAPDTVEIVGGGSSRLEPMFGRGWVAIGDAGAAFDPVSGQGIANALVSGFIAARASADHFSGRADALAAYAGAMRETHDRTEKLVAELYRVTEISEPASMVKRTSYLPNAGTIRSH
jgi:hypothetical protein